MGYIKVSARKSFSNFCSRLKELPIIDSVLSVFAFRLLCVKIESLHVFEGILKETIHIYVFTLRHEWRASVFTLAKWSFLVQPLSQIDKDNKPIDRYRTHLPTGFFEQFLLHGFQLLLIAIHWFHLIDSGYTSISVSRFISL